MADPQLPKNDFSLFPSFSDIPDPPVEEIVEPKSFRNTLIRTLTWMAIIPVFTLFFLLNHQTQSATKDADNLLLSFAQKTAISTSIFIDNTIKMVRFSADIMPVRAGENIALLRESLGVLAQQTDLIYSAWIDQSTLKVLASNQSHGAEYQLEQSDIDLLLSLSKNKTYASRITVDKKHIVIALKAKVDHLNSLYFVGAFKLSTMIAQMPRIEPTSRYSVAVLYGRNQVLYDSSDTDSVNAFDLTQEQWNSITKSSLGEVIHSSGYRNTARVGSFLYIPNINWVVAVSEPLEQRDALIRSSLKAALWVILLAFVTSICAGILTAAPLTRSVNLLSDAVRTFGRQGKLDETIVSKLEHEGTTELVSLGQSLENMAKDIQETNKKLAKLNAELESQVQDRTATVLLRNRELNSLNRLLAPIQSLGENVELDLIDQSIESFRLLLGLSELRFIPCEPEKDFQNSLAVTSRIAVVMNHRCFGWLEAGQNDLMTADRMESLLRLANSLSIVLANRHLVQQLAKEHATLATVFDSITDGVLIIGRSGKVIYANDLAAKLLNNCQPIIGHDAHQLVFDHWKPVNNSNIQHIEALEEASRFIPISANTNLPHQTIDIVAFTVSDLPGFSGERKGLLLRDMTKEAQIENMKDHLMSVVAHELKTPVTALRLQAESLRHYSLEEKITELSEIEELIEESARLGQLIDDLLDISRIEGGAMKLVPTVVQVASLIDRAARLTKSRYAIEIERTIDPDAETFIADSGRITQVFINLFNNAARYKKDSQSTALCKVNVVQQDDFVRIEITDFGRGIASDKIENIFDRFYQADMTDQRVSGGTGLGLSIVRGIVHAHGGKITVQSVLNEYTQFVILLPY